MDPKKYYSILKKLELNEIYIESCTVSQLRDELLSEKNLQVTVKDKAMLEQQDSKVTIIHKYDLKAKTSQTEKGFPLKVSATFCLIFRTDDKIEKPFFDIFKKINLPLNSWPYFREFVQSITQRMNIPPLTLPFIKIS